MKNGLFRKIPLCTFALFVLTIVSPAKPPATDYKIIIDPADLSGFGVVIRMPGEHGTVRLAMAAHPEYHDRYFRYVENFSARSGSRPLSVTKTDEAVWHIEGVDGDLTVSYRISPAAQEREWRQSWKPFLTPTGGMVGDLHSLMYIVGGEKRSARLTLAMPAGWKAVSGLEPTADPRVFTGSVELLLDSPILVGDVKEWKFTSAGVPHTVAIWSPADAKPVDPRPVVDGIQKLTEQAIKAFGKPPYPRYAFLLENGGQAALEHATSLNVGLRPELDDVFESIGHEYVHVWNLMDVRPRERIGLRYKFAEPTNVLWWSEGATIMFADLLIRRAEIGTRNSRAERLASLIARYLSAPGYSKLSAELVSRGDSHPELLRDDWAGTHLQGEVLTNMLDLLIRDSTDGRKKLDDVMRTLSAKFDSTRGIANEDIELALADVCECSVGDFFHKYINNAGLAEFDRYLAVIGMRADISWTQAVDNDGKPSVDLRIGPVSPEGELKLRVTNSNSAWARAGVRTGDTLVMADGKPITAWNDFRQWLRTLKVGDTASLFVLRNGETKALEVRLRPFDVPNVRLLETANATPKQLRIREAWNQSR